MLYSKGSVNYWFSLWFCVGILKGGILRSRNWLGHASEWIGDAPQTATNPITRCYTGRQIWNLFAKFDRVRIRKANSTAATYQSSVDFGGAGVGPDTVPTTVACWCTGRPGNNHADRAPAWQTRRMGRTFWRIVNKCP